jgi:hypothetical protein
VSGAGAGPRFEMRVVDSVLAEDLAHCTRAARPAIESALASAKEEGVPYRWLLRCQEEGRDGTRLGGCVRFYIPRPSGPWGAVLAADKEAEKPALVLVAVGERHPDRRWKPSVYEIAHRRLNREP